MKYRTAACWRFRRRAHVAVARRAEPQYASCDYDVRHNSRPSAFIRFRFIPTARLLRQFFAGWSFSETAFLHSGLPFSVLSQPYIANGNGVFQANGASTAQFNAPAYANKVPGVPLYRKSAIAA